MTVRVFRGVPYARADRFASPEPIPWDSRDRGCQKVVPRPLRHSRESGCQKIARPPLRHSREKPAPAKAWGGNPTLVQPRPRFSSTPDATRDGPIGPQPVSRLRAAMGDFDLPQDEDCLSLTIFAPDEPGPKGARLFPVIIWLHGGAYLSGAGSLPWYDGSALAQAGAVVVAVNYRLGPLSMLHVPPVSHGDLLLRDIEAALAWVHAEIGTFGGDAGCITLLGQSAGAHAIMCLLCRGTGGFHRAVLLSPPAWAPLSSAEAAERGRHFLAQLGVAPQDLANVPVPQLLDAQGRLLRAMARPGEMRVPFLPVLDGVNSNAAFIDTTARIAAQRGIPLIVGSTRDEMMAFFAVDPAVEALVPRDASRRRRPGGSAASMAADSATEQVFGAAAVGLAKAVAERGGNAFLYRFDWGPSRFGACHCIELPFVFGTTDSWPAPMLAGGDANEMRALSATVRGMLAGFARTGEPGSAALPWPVYARDAGWTMLFDTVVGVMGL